MANNKLAIIGGSGLYDVEEFTDRKLIQLIRNLKSLQLKLFDAIADIVGKDEIKESLLLDGEVCVDGDACGGGAVIAGDWLLGISDASEDIEEVAVLGVNQALHLGQLLRAKALLSEPFEQLYASCGITPECA